RYGRPAWIWSIVFADTDLGDLSGQTGGWVPDPDAAILGAAPCEVITLACALPEIGSAACGPLHVHWRQIRVGTVGKCWLGGADDEHGPVECPGLCLTAVTVARLG